MKPYSIATLMVVGLILVSIAICAMGAYAMRITNGETGVGWAVLGLLIVWGSGLTIKASDDKKPPDGREET